MRKAERQLMGMILGTATLTETKVVGSIQNNYYTGRNGCLYNIQKNADGTTTAVISYGR